MKHVNDLKHVKSVSAIVLLLKGKLAGKIIANWSDNPNGSVCTTTVHIWDGPLMIERTRPIKLWDKTENLTCHWITAKAGGGGYCKLSQTVGIAIEHCELNGTGMDSVRIFFEKQGYEWIDVI